MRLTIFLVVTVLENTDWRIALTPAVSGGTIGFVRLVTPRLVRADWTESSASTSVIDTVRIPISSDLL